ncbi:MAG: hypothetical protein RLY70_3290, partial [Planctomycetota bacterium]
MPAERPRTDAVGSQSILSFTRLNSDGH